MGIDLNVEYTKLDIDAVVDIYKAMGAEIYKDMNKQFKEGKIHGPDYANTWAVLIQSVISGSLNAVVSLQSKETEADKCIKLANCSLIKEQERKLTYEIDTLLVDDHKIKQKQAEKVAYEIDKVMPSQVALSTRQEKGFDDNVRQKLFEAQMNAWAMMFSSGLLETVPCFISSDQATLLYNGILNHKMPGNSPIGCSPAPTPISAANVAMPMSGIVGSNVANDEEIELEIDEPEIEDMMKNMENNEEEK